MPTDYLLSISVLPLAMAISILAAPRVAERFLYPRNSETRLADKHWSIQNAHFFEFSLCRSYLRLASVFLGLVMFICLWHHTESCFTFLGIPLLLVAFTRQQFRFHRVVNSLRAQWGRVDLTPFELPFGIRLLFQLPTLFFASSLLFIPAEFSLTSVTSIALIAILGISWYGSGNLWLARIVGTLKQAPPEISSGIHSLADQMQIAPKPRVFEAKTDYLNAFAYGAMHCVVFTAPLLHYFPHEQVLAIAMHELGHLKESRIQKAARLLYPLVYLPFFLIRPLGSLWGMTEAIFVSLLLYFLLSRLFGAFQRKAEFEADKHTEPMDDSESQAAFSEGLLELHKQALLPANHGANGSASHPSLYDRLESLGHPLDFPKPEPPDSGKPLGAALRYFFLCLVVLVAIQVAISLLIE